MRVKAVELDGAFGRDSGLDRIDDDLGVTGGFAIDLCDEKDALVVDEFCGQLLDVERLPHIVVQVIGGVFRMMRECVPESGVSEVGEHLCVRCGRLSDLYRIHLENGIRRFIDGQRG